MSPVDWEARRASAEAGRRARRKMIADKRRQEREAREAEDESYAPPNPLPRYAVVKGRGRCRVLGYAGRGYFDLLTSRDARLQIHRDRILFLP